CHAAPPVFGGVGSSREEGRPMSHETGRDERRPGGATAAPSDRPLAVLGERARRVAPLSLAGSALPIGKAAR
ncbi:hypothetical protein AB0K52_16065, partial [Glycomyces sp. NPDC049804]|uniref:hypothetical protein n=1 Tax=Glycomyces sp. NPDC049804 TaxID=3154363 RepID=UPI00342E13AA